MSFKSKHLSYSQNEPAFLRRIRGDIRASVDDPDRQINPVARPTVSQRLKKDAEDDAPTYVLDGTNQDLSKEQYAALLKGEEAAAKDAFEEKAEGATESALNTLEDTVVTAVNSKQRVAEIGGLPRKRRAPKLVGQGEDDFYDTSKTRTGTGLGNKEEKKPAKKKKAKAIKLSFGDDEES
ncbi:hypothetical protein E2P81_ATG09956 [Venturia nashicola]|uniref:DUF4604 domain-containing protein n=1 Tax=Venturia nashicola TaxID=86259 RepID=A0A4Z1NCG9_9PEZI|nr:hypothetical protein E6O75_ATG10174 [Venturia nashicola]TLD15108.1 hypothetical protein E2P81_ATG09956 [Venturia nashicola]